MVTNKCFWLVLLVAPSRLGRLLFTFKTTRISSWSLIEEGQTFVSFTKSAFETNAAPISDSVDPVILLGRLLTCYRL